MPNQVDGALVHAMSGNELSRVRTEFRLRPPKPINQCLLESRKPTLLCNQVLWGDFTYPINALHIQAFVVFSGPACHGSKDSHKSRYPLHVRASAL
jgi:hypothetical protein